MTSPKDPLIPYAPIRRATVPHPSERARQDPSTVTDTQDLLDMLLVAARKVWTKDERFGIDLVCQHALLEAAARTGSVTAKELPKIVKGAQTLLKKEWERR